MSTATIDLDLPARAPDAIPFSRLLDVESRKLVDTRAGFWLLTGMGAAMVAMGAGVAVLGGAFPTDWAGASQAVLTPLALLLPVLAALTMTSEWSTRTALITFTLEPRRWRVLAAKAVVLVGAVAVGVLLSLAVGAGAVLLQNALHGTEMVWALPASAMAGMILTLACSVFFGAVLGLLLLNPAAAIVAIFVIPNVLAAAAALSKPAAAVLDWVNYTQTLTFLSQGWGGGQDWARVLVSVVVMIGLPAAFGVRRTLSREAS